MNRRAAIAAVLFPALPTLPYLALVHAQPGPIRTINPGDCVPPLVRSEASIARDLFYADLVRWATEMSEKGISRAYVLLDPSHAALMPPKGGVVFAGVHFLVQVAPGPLPGKTAWSALGECGVLL
jgi:hypothetical protein